MNADTQYKLHLSCLIKEELYRIETVVYIQVFQAMRSRYRYSVLDRLYIYIMDTDFESNFILMQTMNIVWC